MTKETRKIGRHTTLWQVLLMNLRMVLQSDSTSSAKVQSRARYQFARRPISLTLRHLDCGSCNGCEQELSALGNPIYDSEQYGVRFTPWPRHAVCLAMTGPFTRGLIQPAIQALAAMPEPAIIAIGDCALGIGPFEGSYALVPRPAEIETAICLRIPGCPPSPQAILEALSGWEHHTI